MNPQIKPAAAPRALLIAYRVLPQTGTRDLARALLRSRGISRLTEAGFCKAIVTSVKQLGRSRLCGHHLFTLRSSSISRGPGKRKTGKPKPLKGSPLWRMRKLRLQPATNLPSHKPCGSLWTSCPCDFEHCLGVCSQFWSLGHPLTAAETLLQTMLSLEIHSLIK